LILKGGKELFIGYDGMRKGLGKFLEKGKYQGKVIAAE
jgi:hypothetical protein